LARSLFDADDQGPAVDSELGKVSRVLSVLGPPRCKFAFKLQVVRFLQQSLINRRAKVPFRIRCPTRARRAQINRLHDHDPAKRVSLGIGQRRWLSPVHQSTTVVQNAR